MRGTLDRLVLAGAVCVVIIIIVMVAVGATTERNRADSVARLKQRIPEHVKEKLSVSTGPAEPDARATNGASPRSEAVGHTGDTAGLTTTSLTPEEFDVFLQELEQIAKEGSPWAFIEKELLGKPFDQWTEQDMAKVAEFLDANKVFLECVRELARQGQPIFVPDMSKGYETELPHLSQLRSMARMLRVDALMRSSQGRHPGALDDALCIMGLGDTLAGEPILISQLVRIAIQGIAQDTLADTLAPGRQTPEERRQLNEYLVNADHRDAFAAALAGEAAMAMREFDRIRNGDESTMVRETNTLGGSLLGRLYTSPLMAPIRRIDEGAFAEVMAQLVEASELPYHEARETIDALATQVDSTLPYVRPVTSNLIPALLRTGEAQARLETLLDLSLMASTLHAYHEEHGAYPESLDAIAPALGNQLPVDPFTGEPYRYTLQGDDFLLYSLGPNREDDGGVFHYQEADIVWNREMVPNSAYNR